MAEVCRVGKSARVFGVLVIHLRILFNSKCTFPSSSTTATSPMPKNGTALGAFSAVTNVHRESLNLDGNASMARLSGFLLRRNRFLELPTVVRATSLAQSV